MGVSDIL